MADQIINICGGHPSSERGSSLHTNQHTQCPAGKHISRLAGASEITQDSQKAMKRTRSFEANSTRQATDLSELHQMFCSIVFPRLQLADLHALRCTSTALRGAVDKLPNSAWTTIVRYVLQLQPHLPASAWLVCLKTGLCRESLPEDHPLCSCSSEPSVYQQATCLAQLHQRIRAGRGPSACASFVVREGGESDGLKAVPNDQGELLPRSIFCLQP